MYLNKKLSVHNEPRAMNPYVQYVVLLKYIWDLIPNDIPDSID